MSILEGYERVTVLCHPGSLHDPYIATVLGRSGEQRSETALHEKIDMDKSPKSQRPTS